MDGKWAKQMVFRRHDIQQLSSEAPVWPKKRQVIQSPDKIERGGGIRLELHRLGQRQLDQCLEERGGFVVERIVPR
ncbi:MAG: hypothetical protein AAGF12_02515 [Myxococcota bacterium]